MIVANDVPYRVDGGVGRYDFTTHRVTAESVNTAVDLFTRLKGKEVYRTRWFRKYALFYGCVDLSYRKTNEQINEMRQQPGATTLRTLGNAAEHEGEAVAQHLDRRADELLAGPRFDADGRPLFELKSKVPKSSLQTSAAVTSAINKCLTEDSARDIEAEELTANSMPYEKPRSHPAISIDDVGVKKQKQNRKPDAVSNSGGKKKAWTTVAHLEHDQARYSLVADSVPAVLRLVSALLTGSGLDRAPLLFFADGQRTLQDAIYQFWNVRGQMQLILDWYHLQKKCKELGSLALKGSIVAKKVHIEELRRLLWYGLVDRAIAYIDALGPEAVHRPEVLEQIKGYLERNRPHIPCYAVRAELGLRCSSNCVEKENDIVVAHRQKKNGMSWSEPGSHSLAALAAARRNGEEDRWLHEGTLSFSLANAA